jgi:catechol 2,3-dioxygenase-like lactoylglutathione lyase family enzyme
MSPQLLVEDLDRSVSFFVEKLGIENVYAKLARKAVEITQPLRAMPYGKEFYIADPDGHVTVWNKSHAQGGAEMELVAVRHLFAADPLAVNPVYFRRH